MEEARRQTNVEQRDKMRLVRGGEISTASEETGATCSAVACRSTARQSGLACE